MKKFQTILKASLFLLLVVSFTGCVKDTCRHTYTYTWYQPVYKTTAEVRANIKSNPPKDVKEPGKLVILGNYIFLNEVDEGIHVIDNSNPSSPKNIAFIDIPGNVDIAIKGNSLYADLYTDLVTLDISNPLSVIRTKIIDGVFPERSYNGFAQDTDKIICDWVKRDSVITEDCGPQNRIFVPGGVMLEYASSNAGKSNSASAPIGITGSMSRFALVNNYLYALGNNGLNVFNITNSSQPVFSNNEQMSWNIETIFPFKNKLFIGAPNGMFIYDIDGSPVNPVKAGEFNHVRSCDPVIADDNFAYVTLHSGSTCQGYDNQLDVVKLNDLYNAELVKTYSLTSPHGLSKDGNLLFICDGTDGLKIYDASDVMNLKLIKQVTGSETSDVIAINKIAIVVARDGLYQYDYSSVNNIHLLSKIDISN